MLNDKENGSSPSKTHVDGSNANEDEGIFFAGQRITDLDELQKLKQSMKSVIFVSYGKGMCALYKLLQNLFLKALRLLNHL